MLTHVCPPAAVEEWLRCQSTQSPCTQDRVTCTYNDYIHHWPQTGPLRYILYHGNDTCLQDIYETHKKDNFNSVIVISIVYTVIGFRCDLESKFFLFFFLNLFKLRSSVLFRMLTRKRAVALCAVKAVRVARAQVTAVVCDPGIPYRVGYSIQVTHSCTKNERLHTAV